MTESGQWLPGALGKSCLRRSPLGVMEMPHYLVCTRSCPDTNQMKFKWVYFIACKVISQSYFLKEFFKPLWTYLLEKVFVGIIS